MEASWSSLGVGRRSAIARANHNQFEFAELVWSDGTKVDRQIVPAIEMPPFGSHKFKIPFGARGRNRFVFAVWDSAGAGAYRQPVSLNQPALSTQTR
jgi:hypothetical protein